MTKYEALKMALEALGWTDEWRPQGLKEEAITVIKETLAQPEQEPVAWAKFSAKGNIIDLLNEPDDDYTPLYTTPPQRTWVGLTDEEIQTEWVLTPQNDKAEGIWFGRRIEAKLRSKNHD